MTKRQRITLMADLWPGACRVNGWKVSDRAKRIEILSQILGRNIESANEINNSTDFDAVIAGLKSWSQPANLKAQLRQIHQPRIRLVHKITVEQAGLLAVVLEHPAGATLLDRQANAQRYILDLMERRFRTRDIDEISDQVDPRTEKSPLQMLRDTLAARINALRNKAGLTIREMTDLATMAPADAFDADLSSPVPVTAGSFEDDNNQPF